MLAACMFTSPYLYLKAGSSVIRIVLRSRNGVWGLKGAFSIRAFSHFYLCCFILAHAQWVLMKVTTAGDRYILSISTEVLNSRSTLHMARDARVVTMYAAACMPTVWLMEITGSRGKTRVIVRFGILREGQRAHMVAPSDYLWTIAETVAFMVLIHQALSLPLDMLNGASNWDFAGTPRLTPAVSLTLDALSAHTTTVHLLCKKNLLLMEVSCCIMHVEVLEMIMLRSGSFSGEEFLLIQMSWVNFSRFWSWTLRFRKLLYLRSWEGFYSVRWLNFDIWWVGLCLLNCALLLN